MKLAVLGTDSDLLRLVAAAKDNAHKIVWLGDVRPADSRAVAELAPGVIDRASEWELLLDHTIADAVLVGRGTTSNELRAEQLKRLAAEAVPLLVVHPACDSVLPYYEVDMARRETGGIVRHYNPVAGHPIIADLGKWVGEGHPIIGPIHQVTCERRVADSLRVSVTSHLARDVETLAAVSGDIRRVTAIGPKIDQVSFASLQVQMTCSGPASLRWSVGSLAGAEHVLAITLLGERGTVALHIPRDREVGEQSIWKLEVTSANERDEQALKPHDPAIAAIQQFTHAVMEPSAERRRAMSTWDAATRAMEVVDAVELSLEKGRTIDVHQQQLTEQLAFRGTMAALGCGLLFVGFAALMFVTILGGAEGKDRPQLLPSWPILLLAVLAFFLLLQFVPMLIAKSKRPADSSDEAKD